MAIGFGGLLAAVTPNHPLIEDLKLKDFLAWTTLSEEAACSSDFIDSRQPAEAAAPFVLFLKTALDLPWV